MRKLASIQRITDIAPIEGADKIEVASILGWKVVIPKGQYQVGDLVVYCEVDSLLPRTEWSEFLFKSAKEDVTKYRLKTIELKKQISQGIVFPLSILPLSYSASGEPYVSEFIEGEEVTENLEIEKYEPYIPAQLQGVIKGSFPSWIPKTDETRIQAVPKVLERHRGKIFVGSEKIDGSSCTMFHDGQSFGVCSRNLEIKESEDNAYWKAARQLDIENKLFVCYNVLKDKIVIQGELYGQGIQSNKYGFPDVHFAAFNVRIGNNYLGYDAFVDFCKHYNIPYVPMICKIELMHNVEDLIELSKGMSMLNPRTEREGIVFRPMSEERDEELGRLSFKVINPNFLLKYKE